MKYLELYYEWMKHGLPSTGLCSSLPDHLKGDLKLLRPSIYELREGIEKGEMHCNYPDDPEVWASFWASGTASSESNKFTPLRQNVVLLMAALNDEL